MINLSGTGSWGRTGEATEQRISTVSVQAPSSPARPTAVCAWCGPYRQGYGAAHDICPTCGMDNDEIAYAEHIMAVGGFEVYRQEYRAKA